MARKKAKPPEQEEELRSAVQHCLIELNKRDGGLTIEAVLEEARDPQSPLHDEFEWDAQKAAARYMRMRARELIVLVKLHIRHSHHEVRVPFFLHDPSLPPKMNGYKAITELRKNKTEAREALRAECLRASSALRRAREVAVGLGLEDEVEAILASVLNLSRAA